MYQVEKLGKRCKEQVEVQKRWSCRAVERRLRAAGKRGQGVKERCKEDRARMQTREKEVQSALKRLPKSKRSAALSRRKGKDAERGMEVEKEAAL